MFGAQAWRVCCLPPRLGPATAAPRGFLDQDRQLPRRLWINKGTGLHHRGRDEEAITCFDTALKSDPQDAPTWDQKGNGLGAVGQCEEAIAGCETALQIRPELWQAWHLQARAEDRCARRKDAALSGQRFTELAPSERAQDIEAARQRRATLGNDGEKPQMTQIEDHNPG
ncbi:MAG: tetratricopeptide repeat protein [Planctomycetes bacterium]|nr:tetratricopeptide repeat protein [Planctomycetota bacterium]